MNIKLNNSKKPNKTMGIDGGIMTLHIISLVVATSNLKDMYMKKLMFFLIFPLGNFIFDLIRFFFMDYQYRLLSSLSLVFTSFCVSCMLYSIVIIFSKKKYFIIFSVFLFVILDQLIKIFIHRYNLRFEIFEKVLLIETKKNTHQIGYLNFLNIELNSWIIIMIKIMLLLFIFMLLFKIKNTDIHKSYSFVFLFSAATSNLLDTLVWGYTLDYIFFYKLVAYDLKDFYVDAGIGTSFILLFLFYSEKEKIKNKDT